MAPRRRAGWRNPVRCAAMSRLWSNARATWAEQAREVRIEDEVAKRGIKLRGGVDRCGPCPQCRGTDRFSINLKKQVFRCRPSAGGDVIALVQHLDGVSYLDAIAHLAGAAPQRTDCSVRKQRTATAKQYDHIAKQPNEECQNGTRNLALALWGASVDPRGTVAEQYLKSRALDLPDEAANEAIRFHSDCPFRGERLPAMICLVRNTATNEPQAIHRTALSPDGNAIKRNAKTFRMSLAPIAGGAIKIDPDEDVTQGLCIGEGVETCLAGRQMGLWPVWCAVNTTGIEKFPILPSLDGLHIFKEHDEASAKAVDACARRWYEAGRAVIIVEPDTAKDLNDELRDAVR
jgi:putative DNA primase/helicase